MTDSPTGSFCKDVSLATRSAHTASNRIANLKLFFALRDATLFREFLLSFYFLYEAFESEWKAQMGTDTRMGRILREAWTPELERSGRLRRDLEFYYDHDDSIWGRLTKERREYVEYVHERLRENPHLVLAYAHTQYLGLFAGGRIVRSKLMKSIGFFPKKEGVSEEKVGREGMGIFTFDGINDIASENNLRHNFKSKIDRIAADELTPTEREEIIEEAKEIFRRNGKLMQEIEIRGETTRMIMQSATNYAAMLFAVIAVPYISYLFLVYIWSKH
ncbi:heme oxygenase-like protein [Saitoella complicata NRRL Y-17804]|uniref:Uncharacterized protein n=1 Tax=Saitoella complicata (strain BCRC 22490 / CBS 7301 / JCM 7358 / NBRC 10748 / NRRL Y-17804) TaxID=698492 RepID=A0A0E9N7S0_SAICN|nr:heme oxygenase-like protein [Saitoella complicata NRRL Y-17804]ODQ54310.1 heme oxygenase-like protein [Saitoella complicata NRRL Y-17804]GAO45771.1 hypothetical protein G7K_0023-t1 [Saitoella complicata NRRL Y-17804]